MNTYDPLETAAAPPLARATTRNTTDFESFVMRYARAQGASVALIFGGFGLAIGAGVTLDNGALMVAFAAAGLAPVSYTHLRMQYRRGGPPWPVCRRPMIRLTAG